MELIFGSLDGSGYGYGDGDKVYWAACIAGFADAWPKNQQERLRALQSDGAVIAYWLSDKAGKPCNGGRGKPVSPGHVDTEKGPLNLCASGTLHATHLPTKWRGDRWWIVALTGEIASDDDKYGALHREVIGEAIFPLK